MKKTVLFTFALAVCSILAQAQVYDFNDGSWGKAVEERPESGTFTSGVINDVKFNNAMMFQKEGKGQTRVILDKSSLKSLVEFPAFEAGKKEVIIEGAVGTEERTCIVEENVNGKWKTVGDPIEMTKSKETYKVKISEKATQIRIKNGTSSSLYLWTVTIK